MSDIESAISRSTASDNYAATLGRAARPRTKTGGTYGSQSAYGSRDQSPANASFRSSLGGRLPRAPPSMIISPSHTPKREKSVERQRASMTETDMAQLYRKLGEIEEHRDFRRGRAIEKERRGIRVLTKSMSVDNPKDDVPIVRNHNAAATHGDVTSSAVNSQASAPRSKGYAAIAKIHSGLFDDAPLSSTLPASIVIGELIITPGAASLTKKARTITKKREESVSPKTARKNFYDNYSPKSYFSWPKRGRAAKAAAAAAAEKRDNERDYESGDDSDVEFEHTSHTSSISAKSMVDTSITMATTAQRTTGRSSEKRSLMSSLIKTVKDKGKVFRRSKSVDSSPISSTVVRAGVSSMSPAAPSTYEPPPFPPSTPSSTKTTPGSKPRKLTKHQRAASVDAPAFFGVTSGSASSQGHSNVVSSIIAQREAVLSSSSSSGARGSKSSTFSVST